MTKTPGSGDCSDRAAIVGTAAATGNTAVATANTAAVTANTAAVTTMIRCFGLPTSENVLDL